MRRHSEPLPTSKGIHLDAGMFNENKKCQYAHAYRLTAVLNQIIIATVVESILHLFADCNSVRCFPPCYLLVSPSPVLCTASIGPVLSISSTPPGEVSLAVLPEPSSRLGSLGAFC